MLFYAFNLFQERFIGENQIGSIFMWLYLFSLLAQMHIFFNNFWVELVETPFWAPPHWKFHLTKRKKIVHGNPNKETRKPYFNFFPFMDVCQQLKLHGFKIFILWLQVTFLLLIFSSFKVWSKPQLYYNFV